MTEDRVIEHDGKLYRLTEEQLDQLLKQAFNAACEAALATLGVQDGSEVASIDSDGKFGRDSISVTVKLTDGRIAQANAPILPAAASLH